MRRAGAALSLAAASAATIVGARTADAVDTDIAISTTAIDFGQVDVGSEGAPGLVRRPDLTEPHNLFADLRQIWPQLTTSGDAVPIFGHAAPGSPETGTPVSFTEMRVGAYDVRWDWEPDAGQFVRSQLGHPHELVDGRANTDNVVVLVTEYTIVDDSPEAHTVGTGRAVVYLDGRRVEGTWRRETATSPFTLEADGQPILLTPGRTWVELVSSEHGLNDG